MSVYESIFRGTSETEKRVLFCEDENKKYWIYRNQSGTWLRVEKEFGSYTDERDIKKACKTLEELYNNKKCRGGHKGDLDNLPFQLNR